VSFIDSMGLRTLVWAARHSGDSLRIRTGSSPVRRIIELTGVERWLPLIA
jgi:anti-anti-sigma factor